MGEIGQLNILNSRVAMAEWLMSQTLTLNHKIMGSSPV